MSSTIKVMNMSYYEDLSDYVFHHEFIRPGTKNIGWLGKGHEYRRATPDEAMLDRLWRLCKISTAQMRGIYECEFCSTPYSFNAERHGETLLLSTSEIRVFTNRGEIYAAPTLIYHYISVHHYEPPEEFRRALEEGPLPPSPDYFERLDQLGLEWNATAPAATGRRPGGPL